MPQIRPFHLIISMAVALALGGCGENNPNSAFTIEGGGHPAGWNSSHKTLAKATLESCVGCHGENLDGGLSKVSCTACHIGSTTAIHPLQWESYAYARHKSYVATNGTSSCATASCHGVALAGVGTAPNCATSCHIGGAASKHPVGWTVITDHKTYLATIGNVSTTCKTAACHGTDGKGVFLSGPACDQCHSMK